MKPSIPNSKKEDYFKIDKTLYKFKDNKLYISNPFQKGQRIELISNNTKQYQTEATVKIEGNKLKIGFPIEVKQKALKNDKVNSIGIDKGFIDLITTSNNKIYGHRYCDEIKGHIDKYLLTQKERGRYWSLYYKYKTIDPEKAERIKKNNLGYIKFNKNKKLTKETKKKFINQSINRFIKEERPTEIIVEDLSWEKKSKKKRYRLGFDLSTWDKGYLQERLEFKAYENKIKITTVNPAYTSQICSCCGKLGERTGKEFKCNSCNQVLDADYNAAINIKKRKEYASITLYMKPKKVLEILKI
jgi:transposase, IS605 orfB family